MQCGFARRSWSAPLGWIVGALPLALSAQTSLGQTVIPLLRTGQIPVGFDACCPVRSIQSVTANDKLGFAAVITLANPDAVNGQESGMLWGTLGGDSPGALCSLIVDPPNRPAMLDRVVGLSSGGATVYSALLARDAGLPALPQAGFIDSLWVGNTAVIIEGSPADPDVNGYPQYYGPIRRVGITASGLPYWVGDITAEPFGDPVSTNLYLDSDGYRDVLLAGGNPDGGGLPVVPVDGIIDFQASARATRFAAIARLLDSQGNTVESLVVNYGIWRAANKVVQVGHVLPGTAVSEMWARLERVAINEANGTRQAVLCAAETDRSGDDRFVILRNSSIIARSNSTVAGEVLAGPVQFLATNMNGDYAAVWGIRSGAGQALVVDGNVVLKTGSVVPLDQSSPDVVGTINRIYAPVGVALGPMGRKSVSGSIVNYVAAYAVALVDLPDGTSSEVLLEIDKVLGAASNNPCPVDFDGDGTLSVQDIFVFLNAWFAGCTGWPLPSNCVNDADFDHSGALAIDDVFAFINAWFAGCN